MKPETFQGGAAGLSSLCMGGRPPGRSGHTRGVWWLALPLAALCACSTGGSSTSDGFLAGSEEGENEGPGGGGGGGDYGGPPGGEPVGAVNPGDLVAAFEVTAANLTNFTLHGTIPLPPGVVLGNEEEVPFQVIDEDRIGYPTQVEVVTRYAAPEDGADVVEILAQVQLPEGTAPGQRVNYLVLYSPHEEEPRQVPQDVQDLLAAPATLLLRTADAFGHRYTADLYADARYEDPELVVIKDGEIARQVRTHEIFLPTTPQSGSNGTLPHMMGVHAYITEYAHEEFLSVDLRIHNGLSGLDPADPTDDAMGKLYFEDLELRVPSGWTVLGAFHNPYLGTSYAEGGYSVTPIVRPMAGGKMHVMKQQGQFERRLIVTKVGNETRALHHLEERGLAFCLPGENPAGEDYFSWFNPSTGRYFPQAHWLPTLDHIGLQNLRDTMTGQFLMRRDQLATGSDGIWPAESPGLGYAHPWHGPYGGIHGGNEIWMFDGHETAAARCQAGYRFSQLTHRMYTDRQPTALFNKDGNPSTIYDWLQNSPNGQYVPVYYFDRIMYWLMDPFGFEDAPTFQSDHVVATGRQPDYEDALMGYQPIDEQHMVRYTRSPYVLTWLGNDALAKDDLRMQAENFRFSYHQYNNEGGGQTQSTGLARARQRVEENPGMGFSFGRGESWGINLVNAAYALNDEPWRAQAREWYSEILDVLDIGQMDCTGIIQNQPFPHLFDAQYRCRQSIEAAIIENALYGVRQRVFLRVDDEETAKVERILTDTLYAMISPPVWSDEHHGPWAMMATAPMNSDTPFCTWFPDGAGYGWADHYQIWGSFAYGFELTGDGIFLDKALEALGGSQDLLTRLQNEGTGNLWNRVALLALAQNL